MIHNDVHTTRKSVSLFTAVSDAAACKSSGGWHRQIPAFSQIKVRARCSLADQLTLSVKRWAWLQCPFQQGVLCWALERKAGNILTDAMFWNLDEDSALVSGAEDSLSVPHTVPHCRTPERCWYQPWAKSWPAVQEWAPAWTCGEKCPRWPLLGFRQTAFTGWMALHWACEQICTSKGCTIRHILLCEKN